MVGRVLAHYGFKLESRNLCRTCVDAESGSIHAYKIGNKKVRCAKK